MKAVHWLGAASLLVVLTAGCSDTDRAKNEARDANKEVAAEQKDVQDAAQKLQEEEGELREAQIEADAKATKLENEIAKDTTARRKP